VLGTAKYMSPEQAMGDPLGPPSDLYSLGVVLYEALTGEVPFDADSAVGVAMKHVTEPPRPPREENPAVPRPLEAVVMKLLEKKPKDRYPGTAELVADLYRVGEGLSPVFAAAPAASREEAAGTETEPLAAPATVPGGPNAARRVSHLSPRRRHRARLVVAALVALLAVLGAAGAVLSGEPDGPVLGSLGEAGQALGIGKGEVPKVEGMTEEEARGRLGEEGFGVSVEHRQSPQEDEGKVLEQSVPAGREVERGSRIALAVGSGPRIVETPDLLGLTFEEAKDGIEKAGLEVGGRKEAASEEVPEGEVSAQDPAAGKEAEAGTEVVLTISSGPPTQGGTDRVEVPDVSGLGGDAAAELLEAAGCEVAGTKEKPSPEPAGTVLGTDPPIGTTVASGTPVILIVSGGQGVPPAGTPSGEPDAQPAPASSASAPASPEASAPPEPQPGTEPPEGPPTVPPSSPAPAPASPAPSSPPPSSSPAPSSTPSLASPPAPASPSPERDDAEDDAEDDEEGSEGFE
jgi:serine/threonine-protein kinase